MFVLLQVLLRICNKYFLIVLEVQELHKIPAFCSSIYLYVDLILFQFAYRNLKLKRHNHAKNHPKAKMFFGFLIMFIILCEIFYILGCCGNVASVPKAPFISYSLFHILNMHIRN